MILAKILGKKEPRTKEDPLLFAFEKCKVAIYFVSFRCALSRMYQSFAQKGQFNFTDNRRSSRPLERSCSNVSS